MKNLFQPKWTRSEELKNCITESIQVYETYSVYLDHFGVILISIRGKEEIPDNTSIFN